MEHRLIRRLLFVTACLSLTTMLYSQLYIKSEYISPSGFKDENGNDTGGSGYSTVIDGGIRVPFYMRMNEDNRPTAWAAALSGTYASLHNKGLSDRHGYPEILNLQVGLMHLRPVSDKWSLLASLGAGLFTSDLNRVSRRSILGNGGVLFIKHANKNLDWGVGAALNNALGYPMLFPSLYLDWQLGGKYDFKLSVYDSFEVGLGMRVGDDLKLSLVGESKGLMSAVERDRKAMYFVTQYGYAGFQPEYKLAEGLAVFATGGISFRRDTYFQARTLKAFYESKDRYPHFNPSAYFAAGIKYGF